MSNKTVYPMIALRGLSVLPELVLHFDVSRPRSLKAIDKAMGTDQLLFLASQKDEEVENPEKDDIYEVGTVAAIKQLVKLPTGVVRVVAECKDRGHIINYNAFDPYIEVEIEIVEDIDDISEEEQEGMRRVIKELLDRYEAINPNGNKDIIKKIRNTTDFDKLLNLMCAQMPMSSEMRQELLEEVSNHDRFDKLIDFISKEIKVFSVTKEIQAKLKVKVDKNQKDYLLREQLKVIREELGEDNTLLEADEYDEKTDKLVASDAVKEKIKKEIDRFRTNAANSAESSVNRGYIETLLEMPWDYMSEDNEDLSKAAKVLDEDHYGLLKVKERIMEFLAVRLLTKKGTTPVLCLVGPPGTGKTSIGKSIARAVNKEYVRISLGGVHDEAEIRGHRRTYIGAMPGRIAAGMKQAGTKNPVMVLDEIDKIGNDYKGDPYAALLEVLDGEQNNKFRDNYIDIPIDLSEVLFIATANTLQTIPRPLLDRMEVIDINSYTSNEKVHIATKHLLPKQLEKHGLDKKQVSITKKAYEAIIEGYTKEAGVRQLERLLAAICRKSARKILEEKQEKIKVTDKNITDFLGNIKYRSDDYKKKDEIGLVTGLAWTSVGGVTLEVEVSVIPGKGNIEITGQLGDVMKESAKAALSYVRKVSPQYGVEKEFYEQNDIHIHIPEGATPKDGPSAGVTMATALLSAVAKIPVKGDVCMTGEISLRGRVLPIGGLKEKTLAAKMAKMKTIIVPEKNRPDMDELDAEIKEGLTVVFAKTIDDVWNTAFAK